MTAIAPNASHHHTELGIKNDDMAKDKLAQPLVSIRQTGFEDGNNIETETDEGHTGTSNLDMGSYRKFAESAPTWEDGCRYCQGFEDYMYLLLPNKTITAHESDGVYNHVYNMPPNVDKDLPVATIYHGFAKTKTDARIFNNAMLNEFEFTMSADDKPTVKPTFISDYNNVNIIEPTSNLLPDHLARTAMAQHTSVYIGDVGATGIWDGVTGDGEGMMKPIDCFKEASFTVNHNAESQSCHGDAFGINTKIMGARELTGSITMPWVDATKYFETEYECYNKYGHIVSEEITQKQVWYVIDGGSIVVARDTNTLGTGETLVKTIVTNEGESNETTTYMVDTGISYRTVFKVPVMEVTNVTSPKSGNEAKDLTMEWKGIEQSTQSYLIAEVRTDLEDVHLDTSEGKALSFYYPENNQALLDENSPFKTASSP